MQKPIDYNRKWAERQYRLPRWLRLLMMPVTYPHELCHYLVGRLLGMEIELFELHVSYKSSSIWKDIPMLLAPTLLGFSIMVGAFQTADTNQTTADFIFVYGLAMFISCAADWYSIAKKVTSRSAKRLVK